LAEHIFLLKDNCNSHLLLRTLIIHEKLHATMPIEPDKNALPMHFLSSQ
jgi:hypothetical protein